MTEPPDMRGRLEADLKVAMRERDNVARDTIRYILSAIKNAEIDKRGPLSQPEAVGVLQRQAKQRQDAIDQFRAAGRLDLVEREEQQLAVLRRYLPVELSDAELEAIAREIIGLVGASSAKDMGKVMPVVLERVAGRADGRRVSAAVRGLLANG